MKSFLLFLVFLLLGLFIAMSYQYWNINLLTLNTRPEITTKFSLKNAPTESLPASVATISGNVNWQSRTVAKSVPLKMYQKIQQGEEISTGANGKAGIRIQNDAVFLLQHNAHVSIIQLLPVNFVFMQDKGEVEYADTIRVPVSVRSLDLVSIITNGNVIITVDQNKQKVTVVVLKGNVKEGYEDLQNNNDVMDLNAGQTFIFDEANKVGTVQ